MRRPSRFLLAAAAVAALLAAGVASAQSQRYYDPPSRVARLSDMRGDVSYSPAGDGEWYGAQRNRPLVRGDELWADRNSRAEVQVGSTWIRMDSDTSLELTQLDDRMLQVEVAEGTVNLRVRQLYPGQRVEVDTPNLAFVIDRPGNFRLDVDREGDNTTIEARRGGGRVFGVGGRFDVRNGDVVVFYGEDVRDYEMYAFPAMDDFDRYARQRDLRLDSSLSARYLGYDVVGYSDLDNYGRWSRYPDYGNVWFPSNVSAGWAPYQDGQWVWQDPWGWTWVDDQPWGFAPSHYGRWASIDGRWGWVPGPRTYRPVYAPALVAFMELAGNSIGWFPLGPRDVYYPTYNVSPNYFRAVNVANTTVSPATVNNVYNSYGRANAVPLAQGAYRNRTVPTAVTAVPQDVFVNARPVREARREAREVAAAPPSGLQIRRNLGLRPQRASVVGAAPQARVRPPQAVQEEQVIVHNAPPPATPTPAATSTPAPVAPVRERPHRFRQVTEQQAMTDARAKGPRHQGESAAAATPPATPVEATPSTASAPGGGRLHALDRTALPRMRGGRRFQDRQQNQDGNAAQTTPTPAAPATAPASATAPAPATQAAAPAPQSDQARQAEEARAAQQKAREEQRQAREAQRAAQQQASEAQQQRDQAAATNDARQKQQAVDADAARQAEEARAAQQKAREEQRQAREAQRAAQQQKQESEAALREAQQQRDQAQATNDARQQQQAADADAKAVQERQQARDAAREAQRQQREAQQAQHAAQQQQAEAQAAATAPAPKPEAAATAQAGRPMPHAQCVPQERIDAMRKRGVPEERIAQLKVCPAQPQQ